MYLSNDPKNLHNPVVSFHNHEGLSSKLRNLYGMSRNGQSDNPHLKQAITTLNSKVSHPDAVTAE